MLAGTLGLMTAHAQAGGDAERRRIARLAEQNLAELSGHPALSFHFRQSLSALTLHWQVLAGKDTAFREHNEQAFSKTAPSRTH